MTVHLLDVFDLGWLTEAHKEVQKNKKIKKISSIHLTHNESGPSRGSTPRAVRRQQLSINALNRSVFFLIRFWGTLESFLYRVVKNVCVCALVRRAFFDRICKPPSHLLFWFRLLKSSRWPSGCNKATLYSLKRNSVPLGHDQPLTWCEGREIRES